MRGIFTTEHLGLSSFIMAGHDLKCIGTKQNAVGRIEFLFDDPDGEGEKLERLYASGSPTIPDGKFYDQLRRTKRMMFERQRQDAKAQHKTLVRLSEF
jgi:hypothetical protein